MKYIWYPKIEILSINSKKDIKMKLKIVSLSVIIWLTITFGCSKNGELEPNIIVFTVDDMDITSVNCYGNPLAGLTPNMDLLATEGIRFSNAHVSSPICMPCRQSMMTGLHPHSNNSLGFAEVKEASFPSLSRILMENGYYTIIKHFHGMSFIIAWDGITVNQMNSMKRQKMPFKMQERQENLSI